MKQTVFIVIALLVLIICVICLHVYYVSKLNVEGMSSTDVDITYYAITGNEEENIKKQQAKMKPTINIVKYNSPPIIGNEEYMKTELYKRELAKTRYNIHIALFNKLIADTNSTKGTLATVIFEDGFAINNDDYNGLISKIIEKTGENDFDFIIIEKDVSDGTVSKIDEYSAYTKPIYAYIINNMNIENILSKIGDSANIVFMDKIMDLAKAGKVNVYVYTKIASL